MSGPRDIPAPDTGHAGDAPARAHLDSCLPAHTGPPPGRRVTDAPRPPLTRDPAVPFAALVRGSGSVGRPVRGDAGVAVPFPDRRTADDRRP